MLDLIDINEKVFDYLEEERKSNPKLTYTLRKSNYSDRLAEGYWFYGTENYLSVSFWSGMDWKNRTPNISFIILQNGETFLEINVSDSDFKRIFVEEYLIKEIGLNKEGRRYIKRYSFEEIATIDSLHVFLNGFNGQKSDKEVIDEIIEENAIKHFNAYKTEDKIYFIDKNEFRARLNKIQKYREIRKEYIDDNEPNFSLLKDKPWKLANIKINNYGVIESLTVNDISSNNKWIFITGENGSGKTNFLRALATVLGGRLLKKTEINLDTIFDADFDFHFKEGIFNYQRENNDRASSIRRPIVSGLAMYGPYRLDIVTERITKTKFKKELGKNESFRSLFDMGIPLLNIDKQFEIWYSDKKEKDKFEKRRYFITSIFTDIVPSLYNILYEENYGRKKVTKYLIKNNQNDVEGKKLRWDELSSGTKSVLAMVGDIMIRLFDQQRNTIDPSDLTGIVIIDEIDLHLHPKAQKDLVINLTKAFPNVQFITSTHSPIPLLGAPDNSIILNVKRGPQEEMSIERIDQKFDFKKFNPNLILTSPIFGLRSLFPNYVIQKKEAIITKDYYDDEVLQQVIREKLNNFLERND